mmetsp:Transcript_4072/g.11813  ORF Transcript_4072/g.11813 Transcript_4072/m.11813 type:complete len:276 (-) Transcript_4072:262-1089(-)
MLAMAAPFARWTTMQSLPTCACARQRSLLRRSLASRSHRLRTSLMASSHPLPLLWTSRPVRTPSARRGPSVRCYALRRPWPRPFWSAWVARLPASLSRRASAADVPAAGGSGRAWLRQRKRTPGRLWRWRNRSGLPPRRALPATVGQCTRARRAGGHLGELCRRQLSGRPSPGALARSGRPTRAGPVGGHRGGLSPRLPSAPTSRRARPPTLPSLTRRLHPDLVCLWPWRYSSCAHSLGRCQCRRGGGGRRRPLPVFRTLFRPRSPAFSSGREPS